MARLYLKRRWHVDFDGRVDGTLAFPDGASDDVVASEQCVSFQLQVSWGRAVRGVRALQRQAPSAHGRTVIGGGSRQPERLFSNQPWRPPRRS